MKIISLVVSYDQSEYLPIVLNEMKSYSNDIHVFTANPTPIDVDKTHVFPKDIRENLSFEPRKWILDNINSEFDYILYTEDDVLIPKKSIENIIELNKTLPIDLTYGFIRYEIRNDGTKSYPDMHDDHLCHRYRNSAIKQVFPEYDAWEPSNYHSGNFIFSKQQLEYIIEKNQFEIYYRQYNHQHAYILESAASCLYDVITKLHVNPRELDKIECHHLPNKYADRWVKTLNELISDYDTKQQNE